MKCFTVLPGDRIVPGIQARGGEDGGFVLLDDSQEVLHFFPPEFGDRVLREHFPPPVIEDGRVFECSFTTLSTVADMMDDSGRASAVFTRPTGEDNRSALVVWRLPPKSRLVPPDNEPRARMKQRGLESKPGKNNLAIVVAGFETEQGFAGMLLMEEHNAHMAAVGGGGPFAFLGLGGMGATIQWDGETLTLPNHKNKEPETPAEPDTSDP